MIYDCIFFFNEIDILIIRIKEIIEYVDKIILIEGSHTFSQKPKISYYNKYKFLFKDYNDKIIHYIVDLSHLLQNTQNRWDYEYYQRNYLITILQEIDIKDDDILMISDVDEIPYGKDINVACNCITNYNLILFHMKEYNYFLNHKDIKEFMGTVMIKYIKFKKYDNIQTKIRDIYCNHRSYNAMINKYMNDDIIILKNSGLHLSSFGGSHCLVYKIQNYSHEECDDKDKKRIIDDVPMYKIYFNENKEKWRINNNFYNWYNMNDIHKIDADKFIDYTLNSDIFDEIKNNKLNYTHFFLFTKGI